MVEQPLGPSVSSLWATKRVRGVPRWGGGPMVEQPLGPSVSSLWATKRVMGVPICRVMAMMMMMMIMMMMIMMMMMMVGRRRRRDKEERRRRGEEERGGPSLQNEDPTPQDGWEKSIVEQSRAFSVSKRTGHVRL